ncbi:MAG: aspartate-semialdehyde dehydrogenase, partial [Euryarchaeota archaeon]|nr:aspartate-semialdehyde dehydrogenase [Euryarchaeota archaeon]
MPRKAVAVLSASGLVGQRFQQRLCEHPWFEFVAVAGSPMSEGKKLSDIPWRLDEARPDLPELTVLGLNSLIDELLEVGVEIVFSALPSNIALKIEPMIAAAGISVLSNASAHRCIAGIPLVIADLNPHHLTHWKDSVLGPITCSTNCTVIPIALPLKPLWDMVGFNQVSVRTEQALSGGGWELLSSGIVVDDCEIPGEAEKIEQELLHLLGRVSDEGISPTTIGISVNCRRVSERDGHLVHVEVELNRETDLSEIKEWMAAWSDRPQHLKLPSAPESPVIIIDGLPTREEYLMAGGEGLKSGMSVVVGNLKIDKTKL